MTLLQQFRELEKKATKILPVVTEKYGYPSFIAYVFKIQEDFNKPSKWYVAEIDEDQNVIEIKVICNYA